MLRQVVLSLMLCPILPMMAEVGFRWKIDLADEIRRPDRPEAYSMGGVTWVSNNVYWAVTDEKRHPVVWELDLPLDPGTGKFEGCAMKILSRPEDAIDIEGIARDPLDGSIWLADERAGTIRQYDPLTGTRLAGQVELPEVMRNFRRDFGLESVTLGRDGLTMWTCAEEALVTDGPLATRQQGSDVRLTRLARTEANAAWKANGQWAYRTDPIAGMTWCNSKGEDMTRSGVSDLCLLDDGTLLVLEREFSIVLVPRFRCRIYETRFAKSTNLLERPSLQKDSNPVPVEKALLYEMTGFAMYEGLCVGPRRPDGSRMLILVSDGDDRSFRNVLALRLSPR